MVLKSLSEKSSDKKYRFQRLYRNLYNVDFYFLAYKNIAKSQGSMTAGTDGRTINDMSMERIEKLIASLKDHSYQPSPARRTYIEKKNSKKKRPLGIPSSDDKLVQEVARMILESIFEPTFSDYSHGFRPKRSCHTALNQISRTFTGAKWFIEGDIKACFDSFSHQVTIATLRKRIDDEYFIALMWKFVKAGYMEQWEYHTTHSGTPQGSGISPILANIYLNALDNFVEELKDRFRKGTVHGRKNTHEYLAASWLRAKTKNEYAKKWDSSDKEQRRAARNEVNRLAHEICASKYFDDMDSTYKRLQYCRYADDWIIGVIGSRADAENIKQEIKEFLFEKLHLELSEKKTKITNSAECARFLGYDINVSRSNDVARTKKGALKRNLHGKVMLRVPHEKWVGKLHEYGAFKIEKREQGKEIWKPLHRGKLINKSDIEIISTYNAEIRGLYNYYCLAINACSLQRFKYIMEYSMYGTFAKKYRSSRNEIIRQFSRKGVFGVDYETKSGVKRCEFYHEGFRRKPMADLWHADTLPQYQRYDKPNSLAAKLKAGKCELCGADTKDIHMRHLRKLKDLKGETDWEMLMMKNRRKSLALCKECYDKSHESIK